MDNLTFDQLLVFRTVAEEGSFSAAARRLGRVQSAVSYSVKNLEENLDVELFDRGQRRPTLTDEGRALLPDVTAVHQQIDALKRRARSISVGVESAVAVVLDSFLPLSIVFPVLERFAAHYPDTRLQLHDENLGAVSTLVAEGRCDIGFGIGFLGNPALRLEEFAAVEMVTLVGCQHALSKREGVVDQETLNQYTQIVVSDRSTLTRGVDHGVFSRTTWRVSALLTKLSLIEAGFGFGSVPRHVCADGLADGRVKVLRVEGRETGEFRIPISSMESRSRPPGPAGRWLATEIQSTISGWSAA